ncbi:MAG: GatB/YqeY domain-containing protein [Acidobacteriota bacterium]
MAKLTERIRADLTASMKARDAARTSTLRMVQSALKYDQIDKGRELSDEEAQAVIQRAVKQRQDSIEQYTKGNRPELAAKEQSEITLLQTYLPQQLSVLETEKLIQDVVAMTGAESKKDAGKVMKEIMATHRGQVDGKTVQEIVNRLLT